MLRKEIIPSESMRASFSPSTFDAEKRTIDVVFSTGSQVKRSSWFEGEYREELSLKKSHVRLERLNAGGSVLNNHSSYDLGDVIGVVEKAWIKTEDGERKAMATLRFADTEDVATIVQKVKDGILRNISVGYRVHKFEEQKVEEGETPLFRATDWEPYEVSFVAIPADHKAQVRSEEKNNNECDFTILERNEMKTEVKNEAPTQVVEAPKVDVEAIRQETLELERSRVSDITDAVRAAGLGDELKEKLINAGTSADDSRKEIISSLAAKSKENNTTSQNITMVRDEKDTVKKGMTEAMLHRNNASKNELTDLGREFRGMGFNEMARECLELAGVKTRGMGKEQIADLALRSHSTSDFPEILANVAGKTLRDSYDAAPQTFGSFTRRVSVADFKEVSRTQLGDAPSLEKVLENGEFTQGTVGEAAEKYSIEEYGKAIVFTRRMLINDDLSAFTRMPELFGRASADLESDLVYNILIANAAMGDATALFHADHKNFNLGGAAVIGDTSLSAHRTAMRTQVGLGGRLLNIMPSNLLVPAALETQAQKFLATIQPETAGNVNVFAGTLPPIVEPRLDADSATAWYMMAGVGQIDMIELAALNGQNGPMMDSQTKFLTGALEMGVRMDIGAKAIDFRGMSKNEGA